MKKALAIAGSIFFLGLLGSFWNPEKQEWKITQLTVCGAGSSGSPQLAGNGKIVVFVSTCDLADKNRDLNAEIFKWEDGNFTQLTDTSSCQFTDLAMSPDGRRLAFATNCSLNGKNADQGLELGVMDGPDEISILTQGNGFASRRPAWSADSRLLVFESQADIGGSNPDHSNEIFLADLSTAPPGLKRLSNTKPPGGCDHPALAGAAVFARCNDDIPGTGPAPGASDLTATVEGRSVGGNPDKNHEIVSFNLAGKPRQLTYSLYCDNGPPSAQPQGRAVAFMSDCGHSGEAAGPINYGTDISGNPVVPRQSRLYILTDKPRRVFPNLEFIATSFAWSADGKTLAMTSPFGDTSVNREHNQEIFITHLDPSSLRGGGAPELSDPSPVTDFLFGASGGVALNRDGNTLVFESNTNLDSKNPDGGAEIFTAVHESGPLTGGDDDNDAAPAAGDTAN
jgi:Tol biopolymer transport system component